MIIGEVYNCRPTVSNTGTKSLQTVTGNHLDGFTNFDVKYLYIYNQNLNYVPSNIDHFFQNLTGLDWHNSNLLSVTSEDLRPFPELIVFSSYNNEVEEINGDLFSFNPKLRWISFYKNLLQRVRHGLFTNLTALEQADFRLNPCINKIAYSAQEILTLGQQLATNCFGSGLTTTLLTSTSDLATTGDTTDLQTSTNILTSSTVDLPISTASNFVTDSTSSSLSSTSDNPKLSSTLSSYTTDSSTSMSTLTTIYLPMPPTSSQTALSGLLELAKIILRQSSPTVPTFCQLSPIFVSIRQFLENRFFYKVLDFCWMELCQ